MLDRLAVSVSNRASMVSGQAQSAFGQLRFFVFAAILSGCGGGAATGAAGVAQPGQSSTAAGSPAPQSAGKDWQAQWEQTLAAAKKEGAINVSGPPQEAERSVILKFRDAYPDIKLNYTGLRGEELMPRAETERTAGTYAWDVSISGVGTQYPYIKKGFFDPFKAQIIRPQNIDDRKWLGGFDAGFLDIGKTYLFGITSYVTSLVKVNRTALPEDQLASSDGLLDPRWKGKLVSDDPRAGGVGTLAFSALRKELGDSAVRALLIDQQTSLSADKRQFTEFVVRGRYPIGIGVVDPYLAPFWDQGLGKDVKTLPTKVQVMTPGSGGVGVFSKAPHPNATKVFIDWLLSQETQADWAKTAATNSRRLDVPAGSPETKPDPSLLSSYVNFNAEEGNPYMVETQRMAQGLIQ